MPSERHQWILDEFSEQGTFQHHMSFRTEEGISVCVSAFISVYGINKNVFYKMRKKFNSGATSTAKSNMRQTTTEYVCALNWLEDYASFYGDRMPDSRIVYLPYRTKIKTVYEQCNVNVKLSTFYRI